MEDARKIILDMLDGGATKTAIAKAVGVTDMTILSVSQGKTKVFRKLKKLHSVYSRWKAGTLDLSGRRGKRAVVATLVEDTPAGNKGAPEWKATPEKKAFAGKGSKAKKSTKKKEPASTMKTKRGRRSQKEPAVSVHSGFQIPDVTEEMVAGIEEQIRKLQAQAQYMRDLIAIRKKYGQ